LTPSERALITLTGTTLDAFIGIILSDGCLSRRGPNQNARFLFCQSGKPEKSEYFQLVFNLFIPFMSPASVQAGGICRSILPSINSLPTWAKLYTKISLSTLALPCFTHYHTLFYVNGVKVVPECIIELLTPCGLAH
jgi:hypothetical protein